MRRLPSRDDVRRLADRLGDKERLDRLKARLPSKEDLSKLQGHLPTRDDLTELQQKLPSAQEVGQRLRSGGRRLGPMVSWLGALAMWLAKVVAWLVGLIPWRVRLGVSGVLALVLVGSWWSGKHEPVQSATAAPTAAPKPVMLGELAAQLKAEPKYVIQSGLYKQRTRDSSVRYLRVLSNGRGQLIIHFNWVENTFGTGASKVVIETTWQVDEARDEVVFTLNGGSPNKAYRFLLNGDYLRRVTPFRITDFTPNAVVLTRTYDGEVFHWVRTSQ